MPVPSPRNSIRIARGNYADLAANITEIGEGELCFAIDQDKFYSKSGGSLVAVGGGTELYSIAQLGDVTLTSLSNGQFLQWDGAAWVNVNAAAPVDSVNGQIGTVVLALGDVDDVNLTTVPPESGNVLGWNGSEWVPTENSGAGSTINSTRYRYESNTDLNGVGAGKVRFNNTNLTLVTEISFSNIDKNGVDISAVLQNMVNENYSVYFQQEDNAGKAVLYHFTGGCSNIGDGIRSKFPVEYISDSGSALTSGKDCYTILSAQAVADSVTSVNGQQGAVVLTASDVGALASDADLGDLNDVSVAGASNGQFLQYNGANWVPGAAGGAPVDSVNGQTGAVVLDADDIDDSSTTHKFATAAQLSAADSAVQPSDLATVATSGSYNDLADKPTIPAAAPVDSVNTQTGAVVLDADDIDDTSTTHKFATAAQLSAADSAVQPGDLATVATSGSYDDLTNQPTIPAALPDLTDVVSPLLVANGEVLRYRSSNSRFEPGVAVDPAGATMTGTLGTTERTITAGAFDLATGNHWTCGAITVPAPTNATAGTSGLIRITAGPVVWNSVFKFPGGTAPTIASFPAIIPFYVESGSVILMGNVAEGIA